jgi:hypothetical protein
MSLKPREKAGLALSIICFGSLLLSSGVLGIFMYSRGIMEVDGVPLDALGGFLSILGAMVMIPAMLITLLNIVAWLIQMKIDKDKEDASPDE